MVNHPGGEESGSESLVFFSRIFNLRSPVQLDLKKVALFGISLTTTHFHPSPDPQQKYQPATEATPQESLGDRARSLTDSVQHHYHHFYDHRATKQDTCRRAKRSSHMVSPSATTRRPKGTVTHPRAHTCGTPSVRRGGFLPKSIDEPRSALIGVTITVPCHSYEHSLLPVSPTHHSLQLIST